MARVITIFSNKGGVGKTFVCVNTAIALTMAGKRTLVIDLDFQAGQDMARMFNLAPQKSIVDILPELERSEDPELIKQLVTVHSSGVHFTTAVMNIRQVGHITPDNIKLFFKRISAAYDYIIVDVGKTFTETLLSILNMSNMILLVATPDILSVYQIKWGIEVLQSQHFPMKMIKVALNRAESHGGVAWQEVKQALGCDIISRIPSEGKVVGLALNRGIPVTLDDPRAKVSQAFVLLAKDLISNEALYTNISDVVRVRTKEEKAEDGFWEKFGISEDVTGGGKQYVAKEEDAVVRLKQRIHQQLVDRMNLSAITPAALADPQQAAQIRKQAERIIVDLLAEETASFISSHQERSRLVVEIVNEALGLGALEELLADPEISDIMVNSKDEVYIEKSGKISLTAKRFVSNQQVRSIIDRIIAPLGRRIDESTPMVDARLPDGSRINAIIPPLSLKGPMITIRKFGQDRFGMDDLVRRFHSLTPVMAEFIEAAVITRKNMIVSGGTGSGKTTLLNIISNYIPDGERIISIEDAAELKLNKAHWARLESRPPNVEGRGAILIRDLFVNTLRMRPDRIIVGECRGAEVLDMLQAMNTGHDGSLTTLHANSARDAITRLNAMILLSGIELPLRAVYDMVASSVDMIIQISRFSDGSRKITSITEVTGNVIDGFPEIKDVFVFEHKGLDAEGRILGEYRPTGYIPQCYDDFTKRGINISKDIFLPANTLPAP
jgi:pilus assembly protein CpaF